MEPPQQAEIAVEAHPSQSQKEQASNSEQPHHSVQIELVPADPIVTLTCNNVRCSWDRSSSCMSETLAPVGTE